MPTSSDSHGMDPGQSKEGSVCDGLELVIGKVSVEMGGGRLSVHSTNSHTHIS